MARSTYVDGFVLVIPKKNVAKYTKMAKEGAAAWKKFGALDYKECMGNDLSAKPFGGKLTFTKMTKAGPNDTVWFSFVTFKNKKHRDEVNKKVMAYFAKKYGDKSPDMPFDMSKMSYGGFSVIVG